MPKDKGPKLKCRMYEARYPVEGSIVMGKVTQIDGELVDVYLVEYRKKSKLLFSSVTPPSRVLYTGRLEAFRVLKVDVEAGDISLDENPLPLSDIWEFETRFNEAKFVHSVIHSVADDMKMDLKEAYNLAGWPTLNELKSLHNDEKFLACENVLFKTQLLDRIALMRYNSWRIKDPSRLQACSLKQLHDICYAIALTRHGEAFFKNNGKLSRESYLSIQDVFNKAVAGGLVDKDWTLSDLERLVKILEREGYILDHECPLTYSCGRKASTCCADPHCDMSPEKKSSESEGDSDDSDGTTDSVSTCCADPHCDMSLEKKSSESEGDSDDTDGTTESDRPKLIKSQFIVPQMTVVTAGTDVPRAYMHEVILDALKEGPLTCSVFMFPSYKSVRKDVIFEPTADEKLSFEKDMGRELDFHTMLLTGDGVDRKGKHYLEFQDCLGDIENGDRGFLRFAVEPNTVAVLLNAYSSRTTMITIWILIEKSRDDNW